MRKLFLFAYYFAVCAVLTSRAELSSENIWIVYNASDPESAELADFYRAARSIPEKNVVGLDTLGDAPKDGIVSREYYFKNIENPLIAALAERGALEAVKISENGGEGRHAYLLTKNKAGFIVLCRGIPWGVKSSDPKVPQRSGKYSGNSDAASVDSELSARFLPSKSFAGSLRNPLFDRDGEVKSAEAFGVLRVARLDGASISDVKESVKSGLSAELRGARGTVCLDKYKKFPSGDAWYENAAKILSGMGYEMFSDDAIGMMSFDRRFDAVLFYLGWYGNIPSGHLRDMDLKFARGAVSLHIYSFSSLYLRRRVEWSANAVAHGAAATVGNVFEPFLGGVHNPEVFVRALARGACAGEAAYASIPSLSWQSIFLGDPLYRPFKLSLDEQLAAIARGDVDEFSQYAVIRKMNLLKAKNGVESAEQYGEKFLGKMPDDAILWKLVCMARDRGENLRAMEFAAELAERNLTKNPQFRGIAAELAGFLETGKRMRRERALEIYSEILRITPFNIERDRKIFPRAKKLSESLGEDLSGEIAHAGERIEAENARLAAEKAKRAALKASKNAGDLKEPNK